MANWDGWSGYNEWEETVQTPHSNLQRYMDRLCHLLNNSSLINTGSDTRSAIGECYHQIETIIYSMEDEIIRLRKKLEKMETYAAERTYDEYDHLHNTIKMMEKEIAAFKQLPAARNEAEINNLKTQLYTIQRENLLEFERTQKAVNTLDAVQKNLNIATQQIDEKTSQLASKDQIIVTLTSKNLAQETEITQLREELAKHRAVTNSRKLTLT